MSAPGKRMSLDEVLELPAAVPLVTAGLAFGIGRTKTYELAKAGEFPCRVLPLGPKFVVPKTEILAALGIEPADPDGSGEMSPVAGQCACGADERYRVVYDALVAAAHVLLQHQASTER